MSDFIARVKAQLDLQQANSDMNDFLNKQRKVKVDVDLQTGNINVNSLTNQIKSQFQSAGQSAGRNFANSFNSGINNINVKNAASQIANLQRTLKSMNFNSSSIDTITKDLTEMELAVTKITTRMNGQNLNVRVQGIDELGRAVTVVKEFDAATGSMQRVGETITQSFGSIDKIAKSAGEYQPKLEAFKNTFKSLLDVGSSSTNSFKQMVDGLDFSNISNGAELDRMVTQFKNAQAEAQRLNSLFNKQWATTAIEKINQNLTEMPAAIDLIEARFKNIGIPDSVIQEITNLRTQLASINTIDNPEQKILAYNQLANSLKGLQSQYQILNTQQRGMFNSTDVANLNASISQLSTQFNSLGGSATNVQTKLTELKNRLAQIGTIQGLDRQKAEFQSIQTEVDKLKAKYKELNAENKNIANSMALMSQKTVLGNQIQAWMNNNTKAAKIYRTELEAIQKQLASVNSKSGLTQVTNQFREIKSLASAQGNLGKGIFATLKDNITSLSPLFGMGTLISTGIRGLKDMYQNVLNIDSAMTELKKVTNETAATYEQLTQTAAKRSVEIGTSVSDYINSTASFARLGYDVSEAQELAEIANIYNVVGDEIEGIDQASQSIISTLTAFGDEVDAMSIIDKFNEVGNNFAISSGGIGDALQRSASSMAAANNTLDQTIALITAANTVVQDPDSVGTAFKTISMRIRGATTELEAAGLETEGMAESTAKLQEEILALSGVDIMLDENTFKSTYQIMEELADKWGELTDIQRASITELIAGKRQGNIVSSLMENFDIAQKALKTSLNSEGSAMAEHEKWMESLEAKVKQLGAAWESLSMSFLSSGFLKGAVSGLTGLVQVLDLLVSKIGTLPTLVGGITAALSFKNVGIFTTLDNELTGITNKMALFGKSFNDISRDIQSGQGLFTSLFSKSVTKADVGYITDFMSQIKSGVPTGQAWANTMTNASVAGKQMAVSVKSGAVSLDSLTVATNTSKVAMIGMQVAATALNMAISMGLSIAIQAIVQAISSWINKEKEAREAALETGAAARQEASDIRELYNAYNEAKSAYASNVGSKENLESATDSLLESLGIEQAVLEELIEKYGSLDEAINNVTIEALEDKLVDLTAGYQAATETLLDTSKDGWFTSFSMLDFSIKDKKKGWGTDPDNRFVDRLTNAGLISSGSYGTAGGSIYLGENESIEGLIEMYEYLLSMREELEAGITAGDYTRDELTSDDLYQSINEKINSFKAEYEELYTYINDINETAAQIQIMKALEKGVPETTEEFEAFKKEMKETAKESGTFVGSQEDIEDAITNTLSEMPELIDFFDNVGDAADSSVDPITAAATQAQENLATLSESVTGFVTNLQSVQDVLNSQSTGKSISVEDFNSEELKDYRSALEYVNGTMQLNAEKVAEITKAKAEEELAVIEANKAYAQAGYLDNASEIEKLRKKIRDKNFAEGETAETVQASIDSYLSQNEALLDTINGYDVMTSSIQEATSAYQHWLNAQNAAQSGDMFDSSIEAMQKISDTLVNTDSDSYGRIGNEDYKAAVDFVVPESVDHEDTDAVNKYMESIKDLFTYDSDGNRDGLDIATFCEKAVDAGLMVLDESGENYQIAGQKTMEDFAEGLNLSLPLVQAMFGEMEEFGAEFSWADEAIKTIGDLGVAANESAENLRSIDQFSNLSIALDVSGLETNEEKLSALDATIAEMNGVKATVGVDVSQVEDANMVIKYCVAQKQLLSQPDVMTVDTSLVEGKIGEAIALLQEFQTAQDNLEMTKTLGMDTTQAQADLDAVTQKIQGLDGNVATTLSIDTTSIDTIQSSISALSCEMIVKAGVDETAVIGFQQTAHDAKGTIEWDNNTKAVDAYAASQKYAEGQVKWYNNTSLVKTRFYANGTINWSGSQGLNGTAHLVGTAKAGGDWGTAVGGTTLVGELGQEIVVDPHTGRWYTVGDTGAEFRDIPKGAIVFNHKQSQALLENGYVAGRASALASGTAMVTGGISVSQSKKSKENSTAKNKSSSKKSSTKSSTSSTKSNSTTDDFEESFDWIEIALTRIQEAIDRVKVTAESAFKTLTKRNKAVTKEIGLVNDEIELQSQAYNEYMQQANSVGLSETYASKVRNGTMDISTITDEDLAEQIKEYQEYYEKAIECKDAVAELHEEVASLYKEKFDNISDDFDNQLSLVEHLTNSYNNGIDELEARGHLGSTKYYEALQNAEKENITILNKQLSSLTKSYNEAMASGEIEEGSEAWYEMQQAINETKESIQEAEISLLEYEKTMRELEWSHFDYLQERISSITAETEFMIDLMSSSDLFDDKGNLTDTGMATMGLHGQNYNVHMNQADQYGAEAAEIDKQLAEDPYNTDLIERKEELLELQRESILAANEEKQAIVDLVEEGINIQLDSLQELIDTYTESLDSAKDLYEYQKKVKEQTTNIANLQKQLSAYQGDTSEENRARIQKLQVDLSEAMEDLEETQYDQYITDQKKLLDNLYLEYETILNERLDNVDALLTDVFDAINSNSATIDTTLRTESGNVGYTISESLKSIWSNEGGATSIITKYGEGFTTQLTSVNEAVRAIAIKTGAMVDESNKEAEKTVQETTKTTPTTTTPKTETKNPTPTTPKSTGTQGDGKLQVGDKVTFKSGKYYYSPDGQTPTGSKYQGKQVYITKINTKSWATKPYHISTGKKLGSGDLGWLTKSQLSGYATGLKYANKDEDAWVNELGSESIINPTGSAIVTHVAKGSTILDAQATKNIWDMANDPSDFIGSHSFNIPGMSDNSSSGNFYSNIDSITLDVSGVTNYTEFYNELIKDSKFEKAIQAMTVDRLVGRSALAKHKFAKK